MLKIRTYGNSFYHNRVNLHVAVPKRYGFPDNCLVLTRVTKPTYVLFHDNGEIFKSISQTRSRINPPVYRHGLNKYAITQHNNLQILSGTDLANLIFTKHPTKKELNSAVMDYIHFIRKLCDTGMTFKYVY
ncbi:hypothetical protein [Acetilactobacillus jinshanensis]|uniref:Uncharacterized protein n=1 Tax=Acetilactobacillus jinshanensis TaxID=1720083 RepID=A0A4P6ZJW3_9LACO|nr:hypothetical protein [Acetilactobacillus jinshanensis]QBP18041.1 hypothetical protein ELX58_02515 [Acetilactobacillus jinshanensis]URL60904.1 hypothetical protein HGK75_02550 [uncultured bacterium]